MAGSAEQIREHIEVLTDFEGKYREFVRLLEEDRHSEYGPPNHAARLEILQRKILEAAPRADRAGKASGHWLTTTNAPAFGGGIRSNSLTGQVMDIEDAGFMDDGLRIPRMILQAIPVQLGTLRDMQVEAEKREPTRAERKTAEREQEAQRAPAPEPPEVKPTTQQPWEHSALKSPKPPWHERPLAVGIIAGLVTTVGGGLILAAILGAFH